MISVKIPGKMSTNSDWNPMINYAVGLKTDKSLNFLKKKKEGEEHHIFLGEGHNHQQNGFIEKMH